MPPPAKRSWRSASRCSPHSHWIWELPTWTDAWASCWSTCGSSACCWCSTTWKALLREGEGGALLRPAPGGSARLLLRLAERAHLSCLLLTSREKPAELRVLEGRQSAVRSLRLGGLEVAACAQLLTEHELVGSPQERAHLVERYGGNPLALNIVAETIADLFGGAIGQFLAQDTLVFGSISDLLDEQFARLSALG